MKLKRNVLIWLSGADPDVLEKTTIYEQRKYIKLGLIILIPAMTSWLGMWFAAPYIGFNGVERVLISVIWSGVILSIDTYLVVSLDKRFAEQNRKRYNLLAFFRVVISIFLGIIISHPLILRILEPNIIEEMGNMKNERVFYIMNANRDSAIRWNQIYVKELDSVKTIIECKEILLKAEGNGTKIVTRCGESSGYNSRSFRYDRILRELDSLEKDKKTINTKMINVEKLFNDKATRELKDLNNSFSYDYLKRTSALNRLKTDKADREWVSHTSVLVWFILIFLILVDSIAVLSKIITPKGEHEQILTNLEEFLKLSFINASEQKEILNRQILDEERTYKAQVIKAIYQRGANYTPTEIKTAVESILNDTVNVKTTAVNNQVQSNLVIKYLLLIGACLLGVALWYMLKITIFKNSPNDLAIAVSSYFAIISIFAGFSK